MVAGVKQGKSVFVLLVTTRTNVQRQGLNFHADGGDLRRWPVMYPKRLPYILFPTNPFIREEKYR